MRIERLSLNAVPKENPGVSLCLGTFDGLHLGHLSLIKKALDCAEKEMGVMVFSKNPQEFIPLGKSPKVLTSLEDKVRILQGYNVDVLYVLDSTPELFSLNKDDFIKRFLTPIKPRRLIVGSDYAYGYKGEGKVNDLRKDFDVVEVPILNKDGAKVSTQRIISLLSSKKIDEANALLGRDYEITGKVVHGFMNGRKIGFPTANISLSTNYALPGTGVYRGVCYSRGIPYPSIVNVGTNPTIGKLASPIVEAYLDGENNDIYGETIYCAFDSFLRDEKKFESLDELKAQLVKDRRCLYTV